MTSHAVDQAAAEAAAAAPTFSREEEVLTEGHPAPTPATGNGQEVHSVSGSHHFRVQKNDEAGFLFKVHDAVWEAVFKLTPPRLFQEDVRDAFVRASGEPWQRADLDHTRSAYVAFAYQQAVDLFGSGLPASLQTPPRWVLESFWGLPKALLEPNEAAFFAMSHQERADLLCRLGLMAPREVKKALEWRAEMSDAEDDDTISLSDDEDDEDDEDEDEDEDDDDRSTVVDDEQDEQKEPTTTEKPGAAVDQVKVQESPLSPPATPPRPAQPPSPPPPRSVPRRGGSKVRPFPKDDCAKTRPFPKVTSTPPKAGNQSPTLGQEASLPAPSRAQKPEHECPAAPGGGEGRARKQKMQKKLDLAPPSSASSAPEAAASSSASASAPAVSPLSPSLSNAQQQEGEKSEPMDLSSAPAVDRRTRKKVPLKPLKLVLRPLDDNADEAAAAALAGNPPLPPPPPPRPGSTSKKRKRDASPDDPAARALMAQRLLQKATLGKNVHDQLCQDVRDAEGEDPPPEDILQSCGEAVTVEARNMTREALRRWDMQHPVEEERVILRVELLRRLMTAAIDKYNIRRVTLHREQFDARMITVFRTFRTIVPEVEMNAIKTDILREAASGELFKTLNAEVEAWRKVPERIIARVKARLRSDLERQYRLAFPGASSAKLNLHVNVMQSQNVFRVLRQDYLEMEEEQEAIMECNRAEAAMMCRARQEKMAMSTPEQNGNRPPVEMPLKKRKLFHAEEGTPGKSDAPPPPATMEGRPSPKMAQPSAAASEIARLIRLVQSTQNTNDHLSMETTRQLFFLSNLIKSVNAQQKTFVELRDKHAALLDNALDKADGELFELPSIASLSRLFPELGQLLDDVQEARHVQHCAEEDKAMKAAPYASPPLDLPAEMIPLLETDLITPQSELPSSQKELAASWLPSQLGMTARVDAQGDVQRRDRRSVGFILAQNYTLDIAETRYAAMNGAPLTYENYRLRRAIPYQSKNGTGKTHFAIKMGKQDMIPILHACAVLVAEAVDFGSPSWKALSQTKTWHFFLSLLLQKTAETLGAGRARQSIAAIKSVCKALENDMKIRMKFPALPAH